MRGKIDKDWDYESFYSTHDLNYKLHIERAFINGLCRRLRVPSGKRLLDVGCGTGFDSMLFPNYGLKVTGIDLAQSGISRALGRNTKATFLCSDALLPTEKKYDYVFCSGFSPLNWVGSLYEAEAIQIGNSILAHLEPNGFLIFIWDTTLSGKRWSAWASENPAWNDHSWMNYTIDQLKRYIESLARAHVVHTWVSNKRLFGFLGTLALSRPVTLLFLLFSKLLRHQLFFAVLVIRKGIA